MEATKIIQAVSSHFGITENQLKKKTRKSRYVKPRQISMYLLWCNTKLTFDQIAQLFLQDHSNVIYARDKVIHNCLNYSDYRQEVINLEEKIYSHE